MHACQHRPHNRCSNRSVGSRIRSTLSRCKGYIMYGPCKRVGQQPVVTPGLKWPPRVEYISLSIYRHNFIPSTWPWMRCLWRFRHYLFVLTWLTLNPDYLLFCIWYDLGEYHRNRNWHDPPTRSISIVILWYGWRSMYIDLYLYLSIDLYLLLW
jgi:hypothetical protein